jgi:hypothetical protein
MYKKLKGVRNINFLFGNSQQSWDHFKKVEFCSIYPPRLPRNDEILKKKKNEDDTVDRMTVDSLSQVASEGQLLHVVFRYLTRSLSPYL